MALAPQTPLDAETWDGSILRGDAAPADAAPLEDLVRAIEERCAVLGGDPGPAPIRHAPVGSAPLYRRNASEHLETHTVEYALHWLAGRFLCLDGAHFVAYLTTGYQDLGTIGPGASGPGRARRNPASSIAFPPARPPAPHSAMSDAAALERYREFLIDAASLLAAMRYVRADAPVARSSFTAVRRRVHEWDAEGTEERNEDTIKPPGRITFTNAAGIPARALLLPVWPEQARPYLETHRATGSRTPRPGVWDPPEYDYVQRCDAIRYRDYFANGLLPEWRESSRIDTAADTSSRTRTAWERDAEGKETSRRTYADDRGHLDIPPAWYEASLADGGGVYELGVPYDLGEVRPRSERSFEAPGADPAYVAAMDDAQFYDFYYHGLIGLVPILDYGPYFQHRAADAAAPQPEPESNP